MNAAMIKRARTLADRVIKLVDQPQNIKEQFSHPFSASVTLECKHRGLKLYVRGQSSPYSNGSLVVRVTQGRLTMLNAEGPYMHGLLDIKTFVPGAWEKTVS